MYGISIPKMVLGALFSTFFISRLLIWPLKRMQIKGAIVLANVLSCVVICAPIVPFGFWWGYLLFIIAQLIWLGIDLYGKRAGWRW
jgi:hypothetical protein